MSAIQRLPGSRNLSAAVIHRDQVYCSGIVSAVEGDVAAQTRNVLEQLDGVLAKANSRRDLLLMVNIWLANIDDFETMNSVWMAWASPDALPARATVESRLARPELSVEIAAVAALA